MNVYQAPKLVRSKSPSPFVADVQEEELLRQLSFAFSHEMDAPLRQIQSFLDLLETELNASTTSPNTKWLLNRLAESVRILKGQHEAMYAYTKEGRIELKVEEFFMDELIKICIDELQEVATVNVSATLERISVSTDPFLVKSILDELLTNAWKFGKAGTIPSLEIALQKQGENLHIEVKDHGIGFCTKYMDNLFVLFRSMHSSIDHPSVGLGAGLALAARRADRLGGKIVADAIPDGGARFCLVLPC